MEDTAVNDTYPLFSNDSALLLLDEDGEPLDCPDYSKETARFLEKFAFWTEGVVLCAIAVPGIFGNALSSYILAGKSMRNSFNLLLIALAVIDNTYLVCAILESCRKRFHLQTDLHILLFPYFLYPLHMMAMTGSILMTVAIALERYNAVHWPISYSQTMNDSRALKIRVLKYLVPVTIISILFNITKFFEITVIWIPIKMAGNATVGMIHNVTDVASNLTFTEAPPAQLNSTLNEDIRYRIGLNVTSFRTDPIYSINFNWFRFIAIGVIPFLMLVYFNTQIYLDIRKQRRRKLARAKKIETAIVQEQQMMTSPHSGWRKHLRQLLPKKSQERKQEKESIQMVDCVADKVDKKVRHKAKGRHPRRAVFRAVVEQHEPAVEEPLVNHSKDELQVPGGPQKNTPSLTDPSKGGDNNASASGKDSSSVSSKGQLGESPCSSCEESCSKCPDCPACCCFDSKNPEAIVASNAVENGHMQHHESETKIEKEIIDSQKTRSDSAVATMAVSAARISLKAVTSNGSRPKVTAGGHPKPSKEEKERGRTENSLAVIMMVYVLIFLICHSPRLILSLHELTTIRNAMACDRAGLKSFAVWSWVVMNISHLLLAINSAINILIYCCLSNKFREEGILVWRKMVSALSCGRLFQKDTMNPNIRGRNFRRANKL